MQKTNTIFHFVFIFFLLTCMFVQGQDLYPQQAEIWRMNHSSDSVFLIQNTQSQRINNRVCDSKRLLINTGVNIGMATLKFGILWISPESFSCWDKETLRQKGWCKSWKHHIKAGPVKDNDSFFMNGIMHPWGGAVYYMSARGSGCRWWESFIYSGMLSTFMWEYGMEAFAEIPSRQDLIITPVAGSVMGEAFFVLKRKIVQNNTRILNSRFLGRSVLLIIDPVNEITDALGYSKLSKTGITSSFIPLNNPVHSSSGVGLALTINF